MPKKGGKKHNKAKAKGGATAAAATAAPKPDAQNIVYVAPPWSLWRDWSLIESSLLTQK